jgi:hypothetical protein
MSKTTEAQLRMTNIQRGTATHPLIPEPLSDAIRKYPTSVNAIDVTTSTPVVAQIAENVDLHLMDTSQTSLKSMFVSR